MPPPARKPQPAVNPGLAAMLIVLAAAPAVSASPQPADAPHDAAGEFTVSRTFDGAPFGYRMKLLSTKPGYRVYRLTYPSPVVTPVEQNNTVPADFYLPEGIEAGGPKRPAVVCLHILEGNFELVHMTCSVLASRGIPAIMFKLPYYGERSLPGGRRQLASNPRLFVEALSQGFQDVRRTVDLLASRPEVDPRRIGITGISMGGIVAATAAGQDQRLFRAVLILSGGDLHHIIHHARETRNLSRMIRSMPLPERSKLEREIEAVDPLRHAAGLRDRATGGRVLMINATEDRTIAPSCTRKLASALGIADRVVWLQGLGHYTAMAALPDALRQTADFFARDLPPGTKPPDRSAAVGTARQRVVSMLQQAGAFLVAEPKPGRCHFIDLELSATLRDGQQIEAELRFVRGREHRFSLHCRLPVVGKVALGQGAALGQGTGPWMAAGEKVVFRGTPSGDAQPGNPLAFAEKGHLLKLQMISGLLAALAIAPDTLDSWAAIEDDPPAEGTTAEGTTAVRILNKRKKDDRVRIVFDRDGKTPRSSTFQVQGVQGTVTFRVWQLNAPAHDSLFEPPDQLPVRQVDAEDLYRIFSAMFNFAMENLQ